MLKPFLSKMHNSVRGKFSCLASAAGVVAAVAITSVASAQSMPRIVIVNGKIMNSAELLVLDTVNCGTAVPDGQYWLNINTGAWGFQGGRQQGIIGEQCRAATYATPRQRGNAGGTWEDRMIGNGTRNWGDTPIIVNPVYQ